MISFIHVIFAITLVVPGFEPVNHREEMTLAECQAATIQFLNKLPESILHGGQISVGCIVVLPKGVSH